MTDTASPATLTDDAIERVPTDETLKYLVQITDSTMASDLADRVIFAVEGPAGFTVDAAFATMACGLAALMERAPETLEELLTKVDWLCEYIKITINTARAVRHAVTEREATNAPTH